MIGKRIQFDEETWAALRLLASDRMASFQELADEAFSDILAKHGRSVGLKQQLAQSAGPQSATTQDARATPRRSRPARPRS